MIVDVVPGCKSAAAASSDPTGMIAVITHSASLGACCPDRLLRWNSVVSVAAL